MDALLSSQPETWDAYLRVLSRGYILQSSTWGAFKSAFGWRARRLVVTDGGRIVAGAQVLFRSTPIGSVAYVPQGPVFDPQHPETLDTLLPALHDVARRAGAIFLKVEPPFEDDPVACELWAKRGFVLNATTVQPRATIVLDIAPEPNAILARMKQKWRYNIRLAERKGIAARAATEADLPAFYRLMRLTGERDGFAVHSEDYYADAWRRMRGAGIADLLLAEYEGEMLGGIFVTAFGATGTYMYGASSDSHRNLMPNHLLQWEGICWAKARGCTEYDFWGIPDEVPPDGSPAATGESNSDSPAVVDRSGGLWGVYRFKQGFGGRVVHWLGALDTIYRPPLYWLGTRLLRRARGRLPL